MNRLSNIMSVNSKLIVDSRAVANAIQFHNKATNNNNIFSEDYVDVEFKKFRQQQMTDRAIRNMEVNKLFNKSEFRVAYMEFKQNQMAIRAERNKNNMFQEDDLTAV